MPSKRSYIDDAVPPEVPAPEPGEERLVAPEELEVLPDESPSGPQPPER